MFLMLTAVTQGTQAQESPASIDPKGKQVSYAAQRPVDNANERNPLLGMVKNHKRAEKGKGPLKLLKEQRTSLNNLLQKHAPIQITSEKLRKAAKAKAKVPYVPDNNHKHLIVNVIYNSEDEEMDEGMFDLDVVTGELTFLTGGFIEDYENYGFNGGGYIWNGKYRGVYYDSDYDVSQSHQATVMEFDMTDWTLTDIFDIPYMSTMALECGTQFNADGTTSVVGQYWGIDREGNLSLRYATLDDNGITTTSFGQPASKHILAMGVTNDGRLYGVAKDGNLYQIDRTTGEEILIGHTGIDDIVDYEGGFWLQSGEIDPHDNTFYWMADHASVYWTQLCTINLQTGKATPLIDFTGDVECAGMVIAPQQRKDETPAAVTGLTASFGKLETTGKGTFIAPTKNFGGGLLAADAQLFYQVYVNDVKQSLTNNQTTPGATVNFSIGSKNVKNNAKNQIKVTVSLGEDGEESLSTTTTAWSGYGIPEAPKNVAMTFDETTQTATITWEAPTKGDDAGVEGGCVEALCYNIYRVVDGEKKGSILKTPLADDVYTTTYTLQEEDNTMTLGDLSFAVEACAAPWGFPMTDLTSQSAFTNAITAGKGKEVPYFADFANNYYKINQKDFTVINGNNDKYTWTFCPPHVTLGQNLCGAVACGNYDSYTNQDDWFITPGIALEAGKNYKFKANVHGPTANVPYYEHGEVWMGTDRTAEAMTMPVINTTLIQDYMFIEGSFTVPEDGNYYFGIHSVSAPNQWEIALFDIYVGEITEEPVDNQSPAPVELAVAPVYGANAVTDGNGKTVYCGNADIRITLPSQKLDGSELSASELLNVTLTATNAEGVKTTLAEYTAQRGGTTLDFKTENMPSGEYTFSVQATYTSGEKTYYSAVADQTAFLGWDDTVAIPTGIKAITRGDKLIVRFQEQPEPKGAHGAYLPSFSYRAYGGSKAAQLSYYVQSGMTYVYDMIEPDGKTDGLELEVPDFNPSEGAQYQWQWYVLAVSKDANGKNIYSDLTPIRTIIGEPVKAPVVETGEYEFILDAETSNELDEIWNYYMNRGAVVCGVQPIEDQFGFDVGKSWNIFSAFNGKITTMFRKVDISTLASPVFALDFILEDTETDMQVLFNGPEGKQAVRPLTVMDGIQHVNIPLDEFKSWGWIQPSLQTSFHIETEGDRIHDIYVDNVGVYDMQPCNLAITTFEAAAQMKAGEESMVNVTVMNLGQQPVSNYTVSLIEDEMPIQSETIRQPLKPGEVNVVQFCYRANTVYADDIEGQEEAEKVLVANVEADGDVNEDDNMAEAIVNIAVAGGKLNSHPRDVVARQAEQGTDVHVSWAFDFEQSSQVVTESFEDYETWYTGGVKSGAPNGQIGVWKLYDGDQKPTYTWKNFEYVTPYAGEPQAFQVFQGDILKSTTDYYYFNFDATTGDQFLVSMDPADGNYTPQPDDYLISPLVQGGSVVEFYYGALLRKPQGAEILYSETGQDINDFKLLKTLDDASGDDWFFAYVKLPETAKYFAIRHSKSSYTGYGLKIDDITYSKMSGIDHFNVYVDGQLVGTTTETTFTVSSAMTDGKHKIAVTAVFTDGTETVPAYASMNYDGTAIKDIMTSGKPFDVYSTDGKLMRQQTRSTEGLKGVFIIRTDNGKSQSVIMK